MLCKNLIRNILWPSFLSLLFVNGLFYFFGLFVFNINSRITFFFFTFDVGIGNRIILFTLLEHIKINLLRTHTKHNILHRSNWIVTNDLIIYILVAHIVVTYIAILIVVHLAVKRTLSSAHKFFMNNTNDIIKKLNNIDIIIKYLTCMRHQHKCHFAMFGTKYSAIVLRKSTILINIE